MEIKMDNMLGKMSITTVEVQGGILDKELQINIWKTESRQRNNQQNDRANEDIDTLEEHQYWREKPKTDWTLKIYWRIATIYFFEQSVSSLLKARGNQ